MIAVKVPVKGANHIRLAGNGGEKNLIVVGVFGDHRKSGGRFHNLAETRQRLAETLNFVFRHPALDTEIVATENGAQLA